MAETETKIIMHLFFVVVFILLCIGATFAAYFYYIWFENYTSPLYDSVQKKTCCLLIKTNTT